MCDITLRMVNQVEVGSILKFTSRVVSTLSSCVWCMRDQVWRSTTLVLCCLDQVHCTPWPMSSDGYISAVSPEQQRVDTETRVSISVRADVMDPISGLERTTNTFEFLFACRADTLAQDLIKPREDSGFRVPQVLPQTYEEAMAFLAARRNLKAHELSDLDSFDSVNSTSA
jgi:hypothetical protein